MTEYSHSGTHPDADQLNAFLSGALSQEARRESLAHLAQCAECRRIVFMAQAAIPQPGAKKPAGKTRNHWLPALALAAATVAVLAAIVWTRRNPTARPVEHQVATARPPAPVVASPAPAPSVAANHRLEQARPSRRKNGEMSKHERPAYPSEANALQHAQLGVIGGLVAGPVAGSGGQSAEAKKQAPAPLPNANAPERAALGNSQTEPAKAAPVQQTSSAPGNLVLQQEATTLKYGAEMPVLDLRIEPNQGPRDGFSELKGTVTDTTGAMVPGAQIAVQRLSDGGTAATATSDQRGQFALAGVLPGQYALKISASGFRTESQQLDLHAHDLALLSPVLQVGSSAQTVTVRAAAPALDTTSAEISGRSVTAFLLPTKRSPAKTVQRGGRILALDQAGTLFLSRNVGKHWKKVKPVWKDTIAQLALAPQPTASPVLANEKARKASSRAADAFQITTANGAVWLSSDGLHWHRR